MKNKIKAGQFVALGKSSVGFYKTLLSLLLREAGGPPYTIDAIFVNRSGKMATVRGSKGLSSNWHVSHFEPDFCQIIKDVLDET